MMRVTFLRVGVLIAAWASLDGAAAFAQAPLILVPKGDTVLVHLNIRPPRAGGFVVYRGPAGGTLELVSAQPVERIRDRALAAQRLGDDLDVVMRAMDATDESEAIRRLDTDRFASGLLSLYFRSVAMALGRVFVDGGLTPGIDYDYRVVFTGAGGTETDSAFIASVRLEDVALASPDGLTGEAHEEETRLLWSYETFTADPRDLVIGFHVERADGPAADFRRVNEMPVARITSTSPSYVDREVQNGVEYRYRIRAVDIGQRVSEPSETVTLTPVDARPPAAPLGLDAQASDGAVQVIWRRAIEPDAAGYHVERSTGLDQPFARLTDQLLPISAPTWVDSTTAGGTQYFYRVVTVDQTGNESRPSNPYGVEAIDRTPPAPPSDVVADVANRRLIVRWTASPSPDVRGYYVSRGDAPGRLVRLVNTPVEATEFADSGFGGEGLRPGGSYLFRVSAVDHSFNESDPVTVSVSIPDDEAPGPPTAPTLESQGGRYIEIAWSPSTALDVARYVVTRVGPDSLATTIDTLPVSQPRRTRDSTGTRGDTYEYGIVAIDSAGNASAPATARIRNRDDMPPPAPRAVSARQSAGGIEIEWERVVARDLAGYSVYRADTPTGLYTRVTTAPVTGLRFVDPSGRAGQFYVVRSVDSSDNESDSSPRAQVPRSAGVDE